MKIKVTKEHIENGHKGNGSECPISLAFGSCGFVGHATYGHFYYNKCDYVKFPEEVTRFIANFDNGNLVEPFEFEAEV